jgi:hypothetical protein
MVARNGLHVSCAALFFFAEKWTIIRARSNSGAKRKRTMKLRTMPLDNDSRRAPKFACSHLLFITSFQEASMSEVKPCKKKSYRKAIKPIAESVTEQAGASAGGAAKTGSKGGRQGSRQEQQE